MTRPPVIGYYVHHRGRGHLHRALALSRALQERGVRVVLLSSAERPTGSEDLGWVPLPVDDGGSVVDPAPAGLLHWVPRHHDGLRARTALLSRWLEADRPDLVVSDVSQEVTLLCRLHGVPVVSVVLPGHRGDPAHRLGLGVSERLVGFWPPAATAMASGLGPSADRLVAVGALSRYAPAAAGRRTTGPRRLVVLSGQGGDGWTDRELDALAAQAPGWRTEVLGAGRWRDDPWPVLRDADVVLTRAGQSSLADVAASRTPAVVVPAPRPHDEQAHTAAQLAAGPWPALVLDALPDRGADRVLDDAAALDGDGWATWCDGHAAARFADLVEGLVAEVGRPAEVGA